MIDPELMIKTPKGRRLYFLWERERNPQKREQYQEEFNRLLKGDEQ